MLEPTFQFIEKFITDFSWRRITIFFGIVLLLASTFIMYEWQTATSELTRYERTTELLQKLDKLGDSKNPKIIELSKTIITGLNKVIQNKNPSVSFEFSASLKTAQIFYALLPWLLFSLIVIILAMRGKQDDANDILLGFGIVAVFVGIVSYFIPSDLDGWLRYGAPQFLNILIIMYFIKKGQNS